MAIHLWSLSLSLTYGITLPFHTHIAKRRICHVRDRHGDCPKDPAKVPG